MEEIAILTQPLHDNYGAFLQAYALFEAINPAFNNIGISHSKAPAYRDFRACDVGHSQAHTSKIKTFLGYAATFVIKDRFAKAMPWYTANVKVAR